MSIDTQDKLDDFAKFIGLLTGEFGVDISCGDNKVANSIKLPDLANINHEQLDVLYGLCLRQAGLIARSKRDIASYDKLNTQNALKLAGVIEDSRVERWISRRFGGGSEMLEQHFGVLSHNPSLAKMIFGFEPSLADTETTLFYAIKWDLLGRPRWGWDKLFPSSFWQDALGFIKTDGAQSLLASPLRKWSDSVDQTELLLTCWFDYKKSHDTSPVREKGDKQKALEKSLDDLKTILNDFAQKSKSSLEALKEKLIKDKQKVIEENDKIKDEADPLREDFESIKESRAVYNKISTNMRVWDHTRSQIDKIRSKCSKLDERVNAVLDKEQKIDSRDYIDKLHDRISDIEDKMIKEQSSFDEKTSSIEEQIDALNDKLVDAQAQSANDDLSEGKKSSLESKISSLTQKIERRNGIKESLEDKLANKLEILADKERALEDRISKVDERLKSKKEAIATKVKDLLNTKKQLENNQENLESKIEDLKEVIAKTLDDDGLVDKAKTLDETMDDLQRQSDLFHETKDKLNDLEKDFSAAKEQARETSRKISLESKKSSWEMDKMIRSVERELQTSGIEIKIGDQMEEMEGWGGANKAQADFDNKASDELQQSVINGCGGGLGSRDVLLQLDNATHAINEIDPNEIFEDVERLSPLSGFSQSGVDKGDSTNKKPLTHNSSTFATEKHRVWSKKFDKISICKGRSSSKVGELRREFKQTILDTKRIFAKKLKPSYKSKFIGNKEEGDIDNRSVWKLAANQGDDFFEVIQKRPDSKTSATILVDISGSCASINKGDEAKDPAKMLQAVVLSLSEALSASHVPHEILGYCAPINENLQKQDIPNVYNRKFCSLETIVYKNFKDKDLSALAGLEIKQADNSDGESLRLAISRLSKQNGKVKTIFMISDGKPFMQDASSSILDADLNSALLEAASKKIAVIGLGFADNHPVMGDSYLSLQEVLDLPKALEDKL